MEQEKSFKLEDIIVESLLEASIQLPSRIFNSGTRQPELDPDRENLILVYPGCFNPPHYGHAALLEHAFAYHGADWNIIAAIVLPLDDAHLHGKYGMKSSQIVRRHCSMKPRLKQGCPLLKAPSGLLLDKPQRSALWNDHLCSTCRTWVFEESEQNFSLFQSHFLDNAKDRGLKIEFVVLYGAEYLDSNTAPGRNSNKMLFSDASRPIGSGWDAELHVPKKLEGFRNWRRLRAKVSDLQAIARKTTDNHFANFAEVLPELRRILKDLTDFKRAREAFYNDNFKAVRQKAFETDIWATISTDSSEEVRLIKSETVSVPISSTYIRDLVRKTPRDELWSKLDGLVLGSSRFYQYLHVGRRLKRKRMS